MYISEEQVRAALTYEALLPAMRAALIDYSAGLVEQPQRMILRAGNAEGRNNGWFAVMPVIHGDVMGVKTVTFFPGNADTGLHTHMAMIELLDRATGQPLAVMDGRLITEMRTAVVSGLALDVLTGPDVTSLGILGSGVQARSHLDVLRMVRPSLRDIRIWSRNPRNAEKLVAELQATILRAGPVTGTDNPAVESLLVRSVTIEDAAGADVVLTATASPLPVLQGRWLSPHAVVLAVGAVGPQLRELDDDAMLGSWVVAESREGVGREAGDVVLSGAPIQAELSSLLASPEAAFVPRGQRIVFKSVGMAIEDLVAARMVWSRKNTRHPFIP